MPFIKVCSNAVIKKTLIGYKVENKCETFPITLVACHAPRYMRDAYRSLKREQKKLKTGHKVPVCFTTGHKSNPRKQGNAGCKLQIIKCSPEATQTWRACPSPGECLLCSRVVAALRSLTGSAWSADWPQFLGRPHSSAPCMSLRLGSACGSPSTLLQVQSCSVEVPVGAVDPWEQ